MFDKNWFAENQKTILQLCNSPIGAAVRPSLFIPSRREILKVTPNSYTEKFGNQQRTTCFASNQHGAAMHQNYQPIWSAAHWWDMRFANRFMPALNLGFDTYSSQPDDTTGVDTYLDSKNATLNSGTAAYLFVGEDNTDTNVFRTLIKFDLSSISSGNTASSATLSLWLYMDRSSNARDVKVFRPKRAWVESETTWNIWKTSNNWSTAGGFHADDCEQTEIGTKNLTATESAGEKQWTLSASSITEMFNGTFTNNGFLIKADTESNDCYGYRSSGYSTAGERPKLVIVHAASGASTTNFFFMFRG